VTTESPENRRGQKAKAGVVEASLIGVAGFGAVLASFAAVPGRFGAAGAALAALTLAIAVVDRRRLVIPDELNALAFVVGLATAGLTSEAPPGEAVLNALLRASLMLGLGDVKLAAVAGVWLNWTDLPKQISTDSASAKEKNGKALKTRGKTTPTSPQFRRFFRPRRMSDRAGQAVGAIPRGARFPLTEDGGKGLAFIEAAVKSSTADGKRVTPRGEAAVLGAGAAIFPTSRGQKTALCAGGQGIFSAL